MKKQSLLSVGVAGSVAVLAATGGVAVGAPADTGQAGHALAAVDRTAAKAPRVAEKSVPGITASIGDTASGALSVKSSAGTSTINLLDAGRIAASSAGSRKVFTPTSTFSIVTEKVGASVSARYVLNSAAAPKR